MIRLLRGDMLDLLPTLPAESFHACVTDPPYHLTSIVKRFGGATAAPAKFGTDGAYAHASAGFMGKQWDGGDIAFRPETWAAVLRVLRPGAHLLCFGGSRTSHRMVCAIEDAGFEIRDTLCWLYGSGFPKSLDVSKAIDRAAGVMREVVGSKAGMPGYRTGRTGENEVYGDGLANGSAKCEITTPATPEAAQWTGWGTALKPAYEPIILARKPLAGTVAANVLRHGCGGINVDACRVPGGAKPYGNPTEADGYRLHKRDDDWMPSVAGRWPANVLHDGSDEVEAAFARFGTTESTAAPRHNGDFKSVAKGRDTPHTTHGHIDSGTASRFFYSSKADKADRADSRHPTVKPIDLMQWLCRLITPPGGHVLDPFAGSGSTGEAAMLEGFDATLIERDPTYAADIQHRIDRWSGLDAPLFAETETA